MPVSAGYVDAVIAEQIAKVRAMLQLMPYPFEIRALEELADRCKSILCENIVMLEFLCSSLREGHDVRSVMYRVSIVTSICSRLSFCCSGA